MKDKIATQEDMAREITLIIDGMKKETGVEPGTITAPEYQELAGVSTMVARRRLRALVDAGELTPDYVSRDGGWGVNRVKGYRKISPSS